MYLSDASDTAAKPAPAIIMEAIVRQLCLAATYNRADIVVAPHILYMRHDELYVDALTVSRNLMLAKEPKLATFKLTGLGALRLTDRSFVPSALFEPEAEKYAGCALMAVERESQPAD
ncbi:hypothetical protein [Sphingomonas sp.]|uniref:hypothetical protein n=1 Tax=Sphingomonas sp. TaxID=28214 RepID=UPI002B613863|nr:hypothetical protein [Sphingomonas sp.]HWK35092.1 hypothetical protein [Sphingomonas sp.]